MHIALLMDASCDLPPAYVERHRITVLPVPVHIGSESFDDAHGEAEARRFFDTIAKAHGPAARSEPPSVEAIRRFILDEFVGRCDCLFCLTAAASRSRVHAHTVQASFGVLEGYREVRQKAGRSGPFRIRVVDTQTLFAASGVVVAEAARLVEDGTGPTALRERLEQIATQTYGYMVPGDLYSVRSAARLRGDRSISLMGAALGSTLDIRPILRGWRGRTEPVARKHGFQAAVSALFRHVAARIRKGLTVPIACVSYGGPTADLRHLPDYDGIERACHECGIELLETTMSVTGMVNVGTGTVTVGFACAEDTPEF